MADTTIRSLSDLRTWYGDAGKGMSDEDMMHGFAKVTGSDPVDLANQFGYDPGSGSKTRERFTAAGSSYVGNLQGLGSALVGGSDYLDRKRRANDFQGEVAAGRAKNLGAVDSFSDVHGVGDFADYAAGQGINAAPYLAEAAVTGGVGGALAKGALRAGAGVAERAAAVNAGRTAGVGVGSYPSSVGMVLQSQRDQNGTEDLGSAALYGAGISALNVLNPAERAAGGMRPAKAALGALDGLNGVRGVIARTAASTGITAAEQAGVMVGQTALNEAGRMAVDPNASMTSPEALGRLGEAAAAGATIGGITGGAHGGWRRRGPAKTVNDAPDLLQGDKEPNSAVPDTLPAAPPRLVTEPAPLQGRIDQALGIGDRVTPPNYEQQFAAAANEDTGRRVAQSDAGQVERPVDAGDDSARQAGQLNTMAAVEAAKQEFGRRRQAASDLLIEPDANGRPQIQIGQDIVRIHHDMVQLRDGGKIDDAQFAAYAGALKESLKINDRKGIGLVRKDVEALKKETANGDKPKLPGDAKVVEGAPAGGGDQRVGSVGDAGLVRADTAGAKVGAAAKAGASEPAPGPVVVAGGGSDKALSPARAKLNLPKDQPAAPKPVQAGPRRVKKADAEPPKAAVLPRPPRPDLPQKSRHEDLADLADAVADEHKMPRYVAAMWVMREDGKSLTDIGAAFGDMAKSTVQDKINKFHNVMQPERLLRHVRTEDSATKRPEEEHVIPEHLSDQEESKPTEEAARDQADTEEEQTEKAEKAKKAEEEGEPTLQEDDSVGGEHVHDDLADEDNHNPFETKERSETDGNINIVGEKGKNGSGKVKADNDSKAEREYAQRRTMGDQDLKPQWDALTAKTPDKLKVDWKDLGPGQKLMFEEGVRKGDAAEAHLAVSESRATDDLRFSQSKGSADPTDKATIASTLKKWFPTKEFGDRVQVHATREDAAKVVPALQSQGGSGRVQGFFDPTTGVVHLIAGNIPKGRELAVFLHEMGVHASLSPVLKGRMSLLAKTVEGWAKGKGVEGEVGRAALQRVKDMMLEHEAAGRTTDPGLRAEETVAYAVEEAAKRGIEPGAKPGGELSAWLGRLVNLFKQAIAKLIGVPPGRLPDLTAQHLIDMAYGAANLDLTPRKAAGKPLAGSIEKVDSYTHQVVDPQNGRKVMGKYQSASAARKAVDRLDNAYGAYRYKVEPIGGHGDTDSTIKFSKESTLPFAEKGNKVLDAVKGWTSAMYKNHPGVLGWLSTEQIATQFAKLKDAAGFAHTMERIGGAANQMKHFSDDISRDWSKAKLMFKPEVTSRFNEMLNRATRTQVWPDRPLTDRTQRHLGDVTPAIAKEHAALKAEWDALPKVYQDIFKRMQADHSNRFARYVEARRDMLARTYYPGADGVGPSKALIDQAAKLPHSERAAFLEQHAADRAATSAFTGLFESLDEQAKVSRLAGPYAPQARFGDHIVSYKSPEYAKAEQLVSEANSELQSMRNGPHAKQLEAIDASIASDTAKLRRATQPARRKALEQDIADAKAEREALAAPMEAAKKLLEARNGALSALKSDQGHYNVEFYENRGQATSREAQLKAFFGEDGTEVKRTLRDQFLNQADGITPSWAKRIEDHLASALTGTDAEEVKRAVREMYLQHLPGTSMLKNQIKRKLVPGVKDDDAQRSFANKAMRDAYGISRMEHGSQLQEHLSALRGSNDEDSKIVGNELARRVAQNFTLKTNRAIAAMTNGTYLMQLGMSPGFMMMQGTQQWVNTAPIMAARHGLKTLAALSKGTADAAKLLKVSYDASKRMNFQVDIPAGVKAGLITKDEGRLLQDMFDRGRIDITTAHDLGVAAAGQDSTTLSRAAQMFDWPVKQLETINRISTALAGYRAERDLRVKGGKDLGEAHDNAAAYADRLVSETHMNYNQENRARFLHPNNWGGWGRVMFQFRAYQQGMAYLTLSNLVKATRGDMEAARAVAYLAGTQLAVAGTAGLPIPGLAVLAAKGIYNMYHEDDETANLKETFFQAMKSAGGETFARLVTAGVPGALGVNVSQKIGMGNTFDVAPFVNDSQAKGGKDLVGAYWLAVTGGPALGIAANLADAAYQAGKGDYAKATTAIMPKTIADILKAADQQRRGTVDSHGNTVLSADEISAASSLLRAVGLQSEDLQRASEQRGAFLEAKHNRNDARAQLLSEYAHARIAGEDVSAVLRDVGSYNVRHTDDKIAPGQLQLAVVKRREAERSMRNGVAVGKRDKQLADSLGIEAK